MKKTKRMVLAATLGMMGVWVAMNFGRLTGDQDGTIRFVLGLLFCVLILFRTRSVTEPAMRSAGWAAPGLAVAGTLLTITGLVFRIHQFEWLGIVLLLYGCLLWALPSSLTRNILPALLLLYWIHPLPSQVFGGFQLQMQRLSVKGAELLLHGLKVNVWADGLVLRTGFQVFGVPEECSGMRTAVTVLLCTLGAGMLFRFRWYEHLMFVALGVIQVLLINVVRIAGMVVWAPRMPREWADHFLHDTLGIFLLISILVVQAEASGWKFFADRRRRISLGIERGHIERPDRASRLPRLWWLALRIAAVLIPVALSVALVVGVVRLRRPERKGAVIGRVAEALMESDLEAATDAIDLALRLRPADRSLRVSRIMILLRRSRFDEALPEFDRIGALDVRETVLKSWALMALKREEEAIALVNALPEDQKQIPGVAIVRAEYAARREQPHEVARYITQAAAQHVLIDRIRALFPYLARHEQWRAIADCDSPVPYQQLPHALLSVHANVRVNDLRAAAEVLENVMQRWPNHPLCLSSLFSLAVKRPGGPWEGRFADNLIANLDVLDSDLLASHIAYAFQLTRPDLAWVVYARLQKLDPDDPALFMTLARFADVWFTFRRLHVGVAGGVAQDEVNLRALCLLTLDKEPFRSFWKLVPMAEELVSAPVTEIRQKSLQRCLEELARREQAGQLALRMEMLYPSALAMLGRFDEAHSRLDRIAEKYPDQREEVLLQHAMFFDQQGRWQDSYETIVKYRPTQDVPPLGAELIAINSMMNLNMGVGALETAQRARRNYPETPQVSMALAGIWHAFGFKEEALFELSKESSAQDSPAFVQLLYESGRIQEAEKVSRVLGVRYTRDRLQERQHLTPVLAELTVARMFPPALKDAEMDAEATALTEAAQKTTSPFVRGLMERERDWLRSRGGAAASEPGAWQDVGRDPMEKATALHRLTVLLARQGQYDEAVKAVELAIAQLPTSTILRRILISLREGEEASVAAARAVCPDDPDIWLASIVMRRRKEGPGSWMKEDMEQAVLNDRFSPATIVRAGDYAHRNGQPEAAEVAARHALAKGRGHLPGYGLAVKTAIGKKDHAWAMSACLAGVEHATDPTPFYKVIVEIKAAGNQQDADLVAALEYLRSKRPEETAWAERLGQVTFLRGDTQRALSVLSPLIHAGARGMRVQSLLMAAEAARLEGLDSRNLAILESAYSAYSDRLSILNNLVYSLAQNPATVSRALELVPELLAKGGDSFVVLDTVAVVYLRAGKLTEARRYMDQALAILNQDDYAAAEVTLNAAEILFRAGEYKEARAKAMKVRQRVDCPAILDMKARSLLERITEAEGRR
jgi:exosortase